MGGVFEIGYDAVHSNFTIFSFFSSFILTQANWQCQISDPCTIFGVFWSFKAHLFVYSSFTAVIQCLSFSSLNELLGFKFRICFYIEIKIICTTRCQRQPHKRERNANSISTWASCLILVRFDFFFFYICLLFSVTTWRNLYTIWIWMATNIQVSRWEFDISTSKCRLDGAIMPHFLSHYLYWFWTKVSYIHIIINFTMLI